MLGEDLLVGLGRPVDQVFERRIGIETHGDPDLGGEFPPTGLDLTDRGQRALHVVDGVAQHGVVAAREDERLHVEQILQTLQLSTLLPEDPGQVAER